MVSQDPTLGAEDDVLVIRNSMKKFESDSHNLEILEVTRPGKYDSGKLFWIVII